MDENSPSTNNSSTEEETENLPKDSIGMTPGYRIALLVIIIVLPILGFWLGVKYSAENKSIDNSETIKYQKDDLQSEMVEETTEVNRGEQSSEFPVGYRGKPIEMIETDVYRYDQNVSGTPFWAAPYFIADGNVHYAYPNINVSTSSILLGVDANSFRMVGANQNDPFDYARDKDGIICDNFRANHIDHDSFNFIVDENYRASKFAKDKNHVFYNCIILPNANPESFTYLGREYSDYGADDNYVFYKSSVVSNNPEDFVILVDDYSDNDYSLDSKHMYRGAEKIGSVSSQLPTHFSGSIEVLKERANRSVGYLALTHEDGRRELLGQPVIDASWSYQGEVVPHQDRVYFMSKNSRIQSLSLQDGSITTLAMSISTSTDSVNSDYVNLDFNSLFAYQNTLYYLKGKNCNRYMGSCKLSLYSYDQSTETERLLATGLKTREIVGYDEEENTLHLRYRGGDAGCAWARHELYDFVTRQLTEIGSETSCEGDIGDNIPPAVASHKERAAFLEGSVVTDQFRVEKGLVVEE